MKISVLTASVRPEGLDIVKNCLDKQDFPHDQFEWIIVGNKEVYDYASKWHETGDYWVNVVLERPKKEGDFYNIDKAYNDLFKNASGELAVMWTDLTWASPTVLTDFWTHYQKDPNICVGGVGDQYLEEGEFRIPKIMVWKDPRSRTDYGSFWEINPIDFEMCLASIPVRAVKEAHGWKEKWDQFAAMGEKELCLRMDKLGYRFFLSNVIEYKAIKHPRIKPEEWDVRYEAGCEYMRECISNINQGIDLLGDLDETDKKLPQM